MSDGTIEEDFEEALAREIEAGSGGGSLRSPGKLITVVFWEYFSLISTWIFLSLTNSELFWIMGMSRWKSFCYRSRDPRGYLVRGRGLQRHRPSRHRRSCRRRRGRKEDHRHLGVQVSFWRRFCRHFNDVFDDIFVLSLIDFKSDSWHRNVMILRC